MIVSWLIAAAFCVYLMWWASDGSPRHNRRGLYLLAAWVVFTAFSMRERNRCDDACGAHRARGLYETCSCLTLEGWVPEQEMAKE